jgi:hypothetical protein
MSVDTLSGSVAEVIETSEVVPLVALVIFTIRLSRVFTWKLVK